MNSVIRWKDEGGRELLPTKVGQVMYLKHETVEELIQDGLEKEAPTGSIGMVGGRKSAVLLEDGWHWVGSVSAVHDEEPEENIVSWSGDVLRRSGGRMTTEIVLHDVDPGVIELLTGVGVGVGETHTDAVWSDESGEWSCSACGAVSGDTGLFNEVGCSVR